MIERKGEIYEFDGFRIEAGERQLLKKGKPVPLPSKAFDLLLTLVENNGHLVEKEAIYTRVWADSIVEDANLTVQMSAIRKALGKPYIETVKGHGYRFSADVRKVNGRQAEYLIESKSFARITVENDFDNDPGAGSPDISRKTEDTDPLLTRLTKPQTVIVGLLLIGAVGVAGYFFQSRARSSQESALPFQNVSVRRLTNTGRVAYAGGAISPDGNLFAYVQSDGDLQSLWVGHTGGGEPVQIREPSEASYTSVRFSPNNSELYYGVAGQGLFRIPAFGGPPTKLRSDLRGSIAFSPSGGEFAFVRKSKGKSDEVVIARSDGTGDTAIEIPDAQIAMHSPAWSPDGSTIVVAGLVGDNDTRHELFAISAHDKSARQITAQELSPVESLAWTRDGDGLLMTIANQLWFMPYPDGKAARIGSDLSLYDGALSMSADGRSLLSTQVDQHSNIWVAPSGDLAKGRQATFSSLGRGDGWSGLDWTADGKIVYAAVVGGAQSIWTMNADGTGQKQLTPTGQRSFHPSVSGDGRYIVYVSVQDRKYGIWRMNIDGTDPVRLTGADTAAQPHISPDGQWVVYITNRDGLGSIFRIPINGGEPVKLTENAMAWVRVSPDSKFVAGAYSENQETKLAIIPIEGGQPLRTFPIPRLANFRLGVRWTPDGKAIANRDWANGIWKQDIAGGEPKRLEGLPQEKLYSFGWSSDGTQFAYTRGAEVRDIVLRTSNP